MKEATKVKIDSAYQNLVGQGITPSVRKLAEIAGVSTKTSRMYLDSLKSTTPKESTTPKTDTPKTNGSNGTETGTTQQYTPSTEFRSPEEVNKLANYLLSDSKKEVTQDEIFTRYAENGEFDSFIREINFIRRNIGKLFFKCKPLLIQLIEPFPTEYKEKALKELNRPVKN